MTDSIDTRVPMNIWKWLERKKNGEFDEAYPMASAVAGFKSWHVKRDLISTITVLSGYLEDLIRCVELKRFFSAHCVAFYDVVGAPSVYQDKTFYKCADARTRVVFRRTPDGEDILTLELDVANTVNGSVYWVKWHPSVHGAVPDLQHTSSGDPVAFFGWEELLLSWGYNESDDGQEPPPLSKTSWIPAGQIFSMGWTYDNETHHYVLRALQDLNLKTLSDNLRANYPPDVTTGQHLKHLYEMLLKHSWATEDYCWEFTVDGGPNKLLKDDFSDFFIPRKEAPGARRR
jgi:hypothetical protein